MLFPIWFLCNDSEIADAQTERHAEHDKHQCHDDAHLPDGIENYPETVESGYVHVTCLLISMCYSATSVARTSSLPSIFQRYTPLCVAKVTFFGENPR